MRNWIIVGLILLVVGLIGVGVTFKGTNFTFNTVDIEKQQKETEGEGVEFVRIENESADVTIVPSSSGKIKAELSGNVSQKFVDNIKLSLDRDGDEVTIKAEAGSGFSFGISIMNLDLKIELPERAFRELALNSGSGNIEMRDMLAGTMVIEAKSGDLNLKELTGDEMSISTSSGNITLGKLTGKQIKLKASSGDIELDKSKADELSVDVASGNIELMDADAKLKADTSSGNITVSLAAIAHPMTLSTGSGNVTIETDRQPDSAQIRYNSGSGDLKNSWRDNPSSRDGDDNETIVFGDGKTIVEVETGSGNLSLDRR
ncbi:DUF4097 family beta strand repeat-containing protein [Paenibacillus spongiae]|uniref:DUF4097 domain-containing protein n=1 Tax=Paenibacillus spongiae TaxID=2909671 RepID=A0ABY5SBE1_9BACL|nr:DUF4097 domain-containing protein [Paenibacillus spongiae]UVI30833.1 DUF4097 domain-containing protein [Paenibacillus spongiae]